MNDKREFRYLNLDNVTIRSAQDGKKTIVGTAVVYNSPSLDLGGFVEIVQPEAFVESLKSVDLRMLVSHDWARPLARQSKGTLRVSNGPEGLSFEADLPDSTDGRDIPILIEHGDFDGMSFCMTDIEDRWEGDTRYIVKAEIHEISVVTLPAYTDTSLAMRSRDAARKAEEQKAVTETNLDIAILRQQLNEISFR